MCVCVTSRNIYPVGCSREFIHTKVSSETLFDRYNCKTDKLIELGKYVSDNFKNQAEDITKDGYVFLKCVLDHDTCNFNKEALNGCVKAVKLKPQKWSVHF